MDDEIRSSKRRHSSIIGDKRNPFIRRTTTEICYNESNPEVPPEISKRNEVLPGSLAYPKVADDWDMWVALTRVKTTINSVNILESIEEMNKRYNEINQTIESDLKASEKNWKKLHLEFMQWKIFENLFDYSDQLSIFEVESEKNLIAFRLDNEKKIKVINLNERKEYTFQEKNNSRIEFLKFIDKGERIIMANRIFIFIWDIKKDQFNNYNILAKYNRENELDIDKISSNKANDFVVSFIKDQYYMHFTISNIIFLIEIQKNDITVKYKVLNNNIQYFFLENNLIFTIISSGRKILIAVIDALTLVSKEEFAIVAGNYLYFSHPILSNKKKRIHVKFYTLDDSCLKAINFSLSLEPKQSNQGVLVTKADIKPTLINQAFYISNSILRVWHACDHMIIINYKHSQRSSEDSYLQGVFDKDLSLVKTFDTPFKGIMASHSLIFVYNETTLSICTNDSDTSINLSISSEIQSICVIEGFIFVKTVLGTICWKMQLDRSNYTLSKTLDANDYNRFLRLNRSVKMSFINVLCYARDTESLTFYLQHKQEFKKDNDVEEISISEAIKIKSTECLRILFEYYLKVIKEGGEIDYVIEDIQSNFAKILTCGAKNLIPFLDSLLICEKAVCQLNTDRIPDFLFYESKTDRLNKEFPTCTDSKRNEFEIKSTRIKVPTVCGSKDSIEITKALMECEKIVFTSDLIKYYIDMKWNEMWIIILCQTIVNWTNCFLVMYAIMIDPYSRYVLIGLPVINIFLAGCEILQVINLGIRKYMGIQKTELFWNLSILISLGFIYTSSIILVVMYMAVQGVSLYFDFKVNLIQIAIRLLPSIIFLVLLLVPDGYVYCFFIFLSYEIGLYLVSVMSKEVDIVERNYIKVIAILVFLGYSCDNKYIAILLSCVYIIERIHDFYMFSKYHRTLSIIMNLTEIVSLSLIWLSYIKGSVACAELSLIATLIAHAYLWYIDFERSKTIQNPRKYSVSYSIYLLIAYLESQNNLFLISFLVLSGSEWIYLKIYSITKLNNDISKLLFNWNSIDICRIGITFFWIYSAIFSFNISASLNWFLALLTFMRGLTGFRAFSWTRFYVRLILSSVMDIASFLLIFVYIAVCFGVLNFTTGKVEGSLFEVLWIIPYDTAFSNFNHDKDLDLEYASFLLASLLIIVIMLNLLISILSNSYQQSQIWSSELDHMEMIGTIFEAEILKIWNKDKNAMAFLAICDFPHEAKERNLVAGKLQDMYLIVNELLKHTNKRNEELRKIKQELVEILKSLQTKNN